MELVLAVVMLTTAALLGNVVGYEIGRAIGPPLYNRDGRILKRKYFDETSAFFDKHGSKALVIGRFVPFVRTYITVVAGVTRMDRRKFFSWSLVGAVLWVISITLLGYFLGNVPRVGPFLSANIDYAILVILLFTVIPIGYEAIKRRRHHHAERCRRRRRTRAGPARRSQPRAESSWALVSTGRTSRPTSASGFSPAGLRSIAHTTTSTVAPRARSAFVASRTAPPGGDHVLDQGDPAPGHVRPLGELAGAVVLGLLAHEERGPPGQAADHRGDRDAAELETAEQVGVLRQQVDHLLGDPEQQPGVGLEEVLVEVLRRLLARAEGELPGQSADRVDVGSQRLVHGPEHIGVRVGAMLASRLQGIPPTIFSEMSALAVRTQSVNLGQGFPDVDGPPEVIARAVQALETGANQYAPGPGVPALRQAIARHQQRHYGLELDPDSQVVVTTGCTEGIAAALLGLVNPGDEVVVLEPYYDSYTAMIQMAGGVRRPVTLRSPTFRLDVDELRAAVTPRTRFVLLNSPHNPTGTVLTRDELQAVADLAIEHDLVVITDEVYEHLVYDGHEHVPLATLPGMFERTLTLSSAGKSYSFTGWKVGWATGPADLVGAVMAAKQWLTFTSGLTAAAGGGLRPGRGAGLPGRPGRRSADPPRPAVRRD